MGVASTVNKLWQNIVSSDKQGLVDFCKPNPFHPIPPLEMIRRPSSKGAEDKREQQEISFETAKDVVKQHGSYLAKEYSKGNAPKDVREVLASQVRRK